MDASSTVVIMIVSLVLVVGVFLICVKRRRNRRERARRTEDASRQTQVQYPHFEEDTLYQSKRQKLSHIHAALSNSGFSALPAEQHRGNRDLEDNDGRRHNGGSDLVALRTISESHEQTQPVSNASYHGFSVPPPVHHSQTGNNSSSWRNPHRGAPLSSTTSPQQNILSPEEDRVLENTRDYLLRASPLPRPLQLQRPVITRTSITPSSKIVTTITRPAIRHVDLDISEPDLVIVPRSPGLPDVGSSRTGPRTSPKLTGPGTNSSTSSSQQAQEQRPARAAVIIPTQNSSVAPQNADMGQDSFMTKEELRRLAPQAILPDDYQPPQFTEEIPMPLAKNDTKLHPDSEDGPSRELNSTYLMLKPYLAATDHLLPVDADSSANPGHAGNRSNAPASPPACLSPSRDQAVSPTPASFSAPSPPARPVRRIYSIRRNQQQQHEPQDPPPESPTRPANGHLLAQTSAAQPSTSAIAAFPLPRLLSTPPPDLPTPTSAPKSTPTTAVGPPSSSGHSQARVGTVLATMASHLNLDCDGAVSPALSNTSSGDSSTTSALLSIISNTTSSAGASSMGSLGEDRVMSPTMDLASPTTATVYSPTTPSSAGTGPPPAASHIADRFGDVLSRIADGRGRHYDNGSGHDQHRAQKTSQELTTDWLNNPPAAGSGPRKKRINHPHALDGTGAKLSQFNFEE
ncbi:hypothetical protein BC939DRAFT_475234 [Gamsiella multidivaricata]|uniref:uncharacterized protein n=1 Tax=Gamsiella multidivaricata TaxID=101098 RepID=UPI0022207A41|nr:uncharacterized protein BC939DRAFT_475234 [Gamsiella multidivaricata]KAG0369184.1 hypothetical protein BGZ54_000115 [Gamsiella multidivaricata]KAI7827646.1 hypothetical protein BC939DRAFT_475234 [Gamsiella multidivaricata]